VVEVESLERLMKVLEVEVEGVMEFWDKEGVGNMKEQGWLEDDVMMKMMMMIMMMQLKMMI